MPQPSLDFPAVSLSDRRRALAELLVRHQISWPGSFFPVQCECRCGSVTPIDEAEQDIDQAHARHVAQIIEEWLAEPR